MGQQISSSKLSSLFAWTPVNQLTADRSVEHATLADCRCPLDILSDDSDAVECARCKPALYRIPVKQSCEITSSLSSSAINNNTINSSNGSNVKNSNSRTFNSFSCFRSSHNSGSFDQNDESEEIRCKIDNINTASCSYKIMNDKKADGCQRNNDVIPDQDCDDMTSNECLSCESSSENSHQKCVCDNHDACSMSRNLSNDSGLSDPSRNGNVDCNPEDNGNARELGRVSQSPNIDRYMNALTDLTDQNSCTNATCEWGGNATTNSESVKKNHTQRCRGNTKANSKQIRHQDASKSGLKHQDTSTVEENSKDTRNKNICKKKQRWVPKFSISKSINKTGKSSISVGHRSVDSGLEVAGSGNDNLCVCTSHRTVEEIAPSPPHHNLTLGFARDRDNWVRAPSVSIESNVTYHNGGRHPTHYSSRVSYQTISGDHTIELNPEQQHAFNIPSNLANLPINIMLTRMPLGSSGGVYGPLQMSNSGGVYSAVQNNSGGVYGNTGEVYGALLSEDSNNGGRSGIGGEGNVILLSVGPQNAPVIDLSRLTADDFPLEDCEEQARERRAIEIAEGVEPPPGFRSHIQMVYPNELRALLFQQQQQFVAAHNNLLQARIHTQVDYIHCLVPDLRAITSCSFYWGKMDRYEAERLLEGKPEGTFLLRDSAQEEYLFSVSFRKYGRSLHARIEQFNHKFSFDSHDPGVYAANTVTGLIEHYKDPACVMFFEPMLTAPLSRTHAFPLQHLCRAVIASTTTYDGISELRLPPTMKAYLKEYHYRQRVRIKRFEGHPEGFHWDPEEAQYKENN